MKEETVCVYSQGQTLILFKKVADDFGLTPGQSIAKDRFWPILAANSAYGLTIINLQKRAN